MEVRKDTRLVHIGYSKFAAVYLRIVHVRPVIRYRGSPNCVVLRAGHDEYA